VSKELETGQVDPSSSILGESDLATSVEDSNGNAFAPFGKTGKPTMFGGSKTGNESSPSPFSNKASSSKGAPSEKPESPMESIDTAKRTEPFPKLNSKGMDGSTSPFGKTPGKPAFGGSKKGSQSSSSPFFDKTESPQGPIDKSHNSKDTDTATTTTPFPKLNSKGMKGTASSFGKAGKPTFGGSTKIGRTSSSSPPFFNKMESSEGSLSETTKDFEKTGSKPKPGTKWSSSPFSKGSVTSDTGSPKGATDLPAKPTGMPAFDTPDTSAMSGSPRINSEAVGSKSTNSFSSTVSEDQLLETEESSETSDSENSGPSWYNSPATLDWGRDDDMLQSSPPQPSEAFPPEVNNKSTASFSEQPSTISKANDWKTRESESSTDTETAYDQPEMFALDPDDGDSGQWWQTRQQDWGMDEEAKSPIVPIPERPRDKPKTWDPHGAVDEPVDIMAKYSSSNGEWWSRGKRDTINTDPPNFQSGSTESSHYLDTVPAIEESSKDSNTEEPESAVEELPDTIENKAEVDLIPVSPNDPFASQFESDSSSTPTYQAATNNKRPQANTNDTNEDNNLTAVSPNDPYDKKFDNDDSLKPIIGNQDGSNGSWYNSPIDSSFFSADRD